MTAAGAVVVFYATNRAKKPVSGTGHGDGEVTYANGKSDKTVSYGTCEVLLPDNRKPGSKDAGLPQKVKEFIWSEDVKGKEVLIFIHGYYNSFNNAMQTAARVKIDADWGGPVIAFSWPSFGVGQGYSADEDIRRESVKPFLEVLQAIKAASKIHILAHSMGNRIALEGMRELTLILNDKEVLVKLGQLIFAAADENSNIFKSTCEEISSSAGRLPGENWTLYMSNHDSALVASAVLHYNNRAGQVWPQITWPQPDVGYKKHRPFVLAAGLDCIDCSGAGQLENGDRYDDHGYFAQPPAIQDIAAVLQGKKASERTVQNEGAVGLTRVQPEVDVHLNRILTLTDNPPPTVGPNDVWWKLNTKVPALGEIASA